MNNVPKIVGDSETNSEIKKVRTMIEESFGKKIQNITSEEIIKKIPKKTQKKFAIYYTKRPVVEFIAELLSSFKIRTVLDPAYGDGRLLSGILNSHDAKATGFDIFPLSSNNELQDANLNQVDFLQINEKGYVNGNKIIKKMFDLIVTNPPYTRFSNLSSGYRSFLQSKFDKYSMKQIGLHAYFLIHLTNFLRNDGFLVAVLPASILFSQEAEKLRLFLLNNFSLKYIITNENDKSFSDHSDFKEIILIAEKNVSNFNCKFISLKTNVNQENNHSLAFNISNNKKSSQMAMMNITKEDLIKSKNWLVFFQSDKSTEILDKNPKLIKMQNLIKIRRGTESFGPEFFYLPNKYWNIRNVSKDLITIYNSRIDKEIQFPSKYLITGIIGTKLYAKNIQPASQEFFVNIPPIAVKELPLSVQQYVKWGEKLDLAIKHNVFSRKKPWYSFLHSQLKRKSFYGNILLVRKLRLNTMGVIAHHLEHSIPASKGFYVIQCSKENSKIICAWLNSSFFLSQITKHRRRIAEQWGELMISDIKNFLVIDPSKIDSHYRKKIKTQFDKLCSKELQDLNTQQELKTKNNLDKIFSDLLQI